MAMSIGRTTAYVGGAVTLCIVSGIVGASIAGKFDVTWGESLKVDFGQAISMILAALGVILTALALLFAVMGIIGWATFSSQVDSNVRKYITEDFDRRGPLFDSVARDLLPKLAEDLAPKLEKSMFKGTQKEEEGDDLLDKVNPDD